MIIDDDDDRELALYVQHSVESKGGKYLRCLCVCMFVVCGLCVYASMGVCVHARYLAVSCA